MFEAFNQDVLQQVAEARLDGPLVARLDLDEVRQRAHLADLAVGVDEHHARRIGKSGAMRVDLFERPEPRRSSSARSCSRVRTSRDRHSCSMRALDSSNSRAGPRDARGLEAFLRAMQRFGRDLPLRPRLVELGRQLAGLEVEAAIGLDGALALGRR